MLVLSRKPGQSIVVGKDVRVTILSQRGCTVRVGIEAPGDVTIVREEVLLSADHRTPAPLAKKSPGQL
jgi:carbon storage regulator